jgi:diguanylate cyclase (GGDEF)-like protein/PAS domain S-box-containing protein
MNLATLAWSATWIVLSCLAAARFWRLAGAGQPLAENAYGFRWLAAASLGFGVAGTLEQNSGGLIGGPPPLRLADLVGLAAVLALIIGLVLVTVGREGKRIEVPPSRWRITREDLPRFWPPTKGMLVDAALFAVSMFAICLVVTFGPDYVASGAAPGGFALDLIRPVVELAALGLVLPLVPRSPGLALMPVLALAAVAFGDILAVAQRSADAYPGAGSHVALAAGLCLLVLTPTSAAAGRDWLADGGQSPVGSLRRAMAWLAGARMAGPAAALSAAVIIAVLSMISHPVDIRAVAVTGASVVVLLVIRLAWFTTRAVTVTASAHVSDWVFHSLADSTSDTVLVCDDGGRIEYVSPAAAQFGYRSEDLTGTCLADLVHPDDRAAAVRAAEAALHGGPGTATFSGRAKAADGSWRQVGAALSRYGPPGEPAGLLVACHDDSELAALRRELTQLTFHDGVTGLPNRAYLEDRVKQLRHLEQGKVAAILICLDEEPLVADLGSQPGENLVLAQAGRRLRAAVPPEAVVARWGSDQFAVLTSETAPDADPVQAAELAGRLAASIAAEPFSVANREVWMTASIGVAASHAAQADQVLGRAHAALLKASQAGGGRLEVFSIEMHDAAVRRGRLAGQIGDAIAEHQLRIDYRPVADLATRLVTRVEARPAWTAGGGEVCCEELLAVAEDAGQVARLGDWLLRQAAGQVARWRREPGDHAFGCAGLGLMISVTARQVAAPGFAASVLGALDAAGLPPQALTLQVGERTLVEAPALVAAELAALRGTGVKLAIADFGTGYASLSYLRKLAIDVIRIDASFTAGLGTDPTLTLLGSAAIGLGRDLGIEMIADGVDRLEQAELLRQLGCTLGQGTWLGEHSSSDQAGYPACSQAS